MITLKGKITGVVGEMSMPGDKSISHRSIMLASMAEGQTRIKGFLFGEDCLATIDMFRQLGVQINIENQEVIVESPGISGFTKPSQAIDVGNSGTTMRLGLGVLAGMPFETVITGDDSLKKRPMARVMRPLSLMGAEVKGTNQTEFAPITIKGTTDLQGITYDMPIASAQVKSAILLASIQAEGKTVIKETQQSRTHTEEMFRQWGVSIDATKETIQLTGPQTVTSPGEVSVPGDISSAAFFMVAAAIVPDSRLTIKNVGLNQSRTGIIDVLKQMGADVAIEIRDSDKMVGDVTVTSSQLKGITIQGEIIPRLIDEIPIIALLATQAEGQTVIAQAEELKHKETNRIDTTAQELNKLGAQIKPTDDGLIIEGGQTLQGGSVSSHGDHRLGMTLAIASLLIKTGEVTIEKSEAIAVSYPEFFKDLEKIMIGGY